MKFCFLFVGIVSAVALAACGGESSNSRNQDSGGDNPVAIVLLVPGSLGDKSYNDSANQGLTLIKEKYGEEVTTKVVEMGNDVTKYVPALEDVSEDTYDLIICGSFHLKEPVEQVAPQYPDKKYIIYDIEVDYKNITGLDNVYSFIFKQNEAGYLAGVLAAGVTSDPGLPLANADEAVIGFLGGLDIPLINDFLVGYITGAQYVNPDVKVVVNYVGSFSDAAKGKELALIQYNTHGVDVGFNVAGLAGLGQIDAAREANRYAIGVDSDQELLFTETPDKADKIISSALKRVDLGLLRAYELYKSDALQFGSTESLGIKEDGVGLADSSNYLRLISEQDRNELAQIAASIISGEISVVSAIGMSNDELARIINSAAK